MFLISKCGFRFCFHVFMSFINLSQLHFPFLDLLAPFCVLGQRLKRSLDPTSRVPGPRLPDVGRGGPQLAPGTQLGGPHLVAQIPEIAKLKKTFKKVFFQFFVCFFILFRLLFLAFLFPHWCLEICF